MSIAIKQTDLLQARETDATAESIKKFATEENSKLAIKSFLWENYRINVSLDQIPKPDGKWRLIAGKNEYGYFAGQNDADFINFRFAEKLSSTKTLGNIQVSTPDHNKLRPFSLANALWKQDTHGTKDIRTWWREQCRKPDVINSQLTTLLSRLTYSNATAMATRGVGMFSAPSQPAHAQPEIQIPDQTPAPDRGG